jgi:DNA-binding transcriptional ArsR family regulator
MNDETLARSFKALSHPRRVKIFRLLASRPEAGKSLDRLLKASRLPYSSLIHHLREMERCGLIRRRRRGPEVAYILAPGELSLALGDAADTAQIARHRPRKAA